MTGDIPEWAEDAAGLPLAFAQVREDPWVDARIANLLKPGYSAILIASGGCTAAWLAASTRPAWLHLVDANPAQIGLSRLKLELLRRTEPIDRPRILGHAPMPGKERGQIVERILGELQLPADVLGPPGEIARRGADHAGRYEALFAALREALASRGFQQEVEALLHLSDPVEQARRSDESTPLGKAMNRAFEETMSLETLIRLFGNAATQNRVESFGAHFSRRTRRLLATQPAASNPYLWQVLCGRYPDQARAPWLDAAAPGAWPDVTWARDTMAHALAAEAERFDLIHLSNILDWLTAAEARATLRAAWKALRPGGWAIVRQLNSTLEIRQLESAFQWDARLSEELHEGDRSYFYRSLHVGRKP